MADRLIIATAKESLTFEHLASAVAAWEDGQRLEVAKGTFEWWYFDAHLEDGSTATLVFSTKPLLERNGPLKPMVQLMLTRPDGSRIEHLPNYRRDQYLASKQGCDVKIAGHWARGDLNIYQTHIDMGDIGLDLTFHGETAPWRPGAGKVYFGDSQHYFAWLPAMPYGRVEGTLTYDGVVHTVYGSGYHDHNWGNIGMENIVDYWYWGRARVGRFTLIFVQIITAQKYGALPIPILLVADDSGVLVEDGSPLIAHGRDFISNPGGWGYPQQLDFTWQGQGGAVNLYLRRPVIIEAISMLYTFPAWQQKIIRLFTNPYYFRFTADLELALDLPGAKANEQGKALFEIMIMQGKKYPI